MIEPKKLSGRHSRFCGKKVYMEEAPYVIAEWKIPQLEPEGPSLADTPLGSQALPPKDSRGYRNRSTSQGTNIQSMCRWGTFQTQTRALLLTAIWASLEQTAAANVWPMTSSLA